MIGQLGGPEEVVSPGDWMDGTDQDLDPDLHHALPRHGDSPIIGTIVYHEQLQNKRRLEKYLNFPPKESKLPPKILDVRQI